MSGQWLLGVDAGGTKTDALLVDAQTGQVRASVRTDGGNHESRGWPGAAAALRIALETVLDTAGADACEVVASAWGLAGLDWPDDEAAYVRIVDSFALPGPAVVVNDAFLVLELLSSSAGVAVVAGTGMVAVGRDAHGRTARTLGVGAGHGEWGSGPDVVSAAAEAVAQAHLGLGPHTRLTARALAASGAAGPDDYCRMVWREARPALVPPDVWDVAAAGDQVAIDILERAADSYATAAASLVRRLALDRGCHVVLAGRVLDPGHDLLTAAVEAAMARHVPGAAVRRLGVPPVTGAIEAARRRHQQGSVDSLSG